MKLKQDEFIREFNEYFKSNITDFNQYPMNALTPLGIFNFINHLLEKQKPSEVSGYTLQNIEESIEFGLQYSFDQKRVLEYNKDKDEFIKSLPPYDSKENEAVRFAEFTQINGYKFNSMADKWYAVGKKGLTAQELFTLYKEGGEK